VEKEAVIGNKKRLWIKRADIKRIFCSKLTTLPAGGDGNQVALGGVICATLRHVACCTL
jgi:hypothetical protein